MSAMTATPTAAPTFAKARGVRRIKNNVATAVVTLAFGVALVPLIWLLFTVIGKGYHLVFTSAWWTKDQTGVSSSVKGGGMLQALIGTAEQVLLCTIISVPIAVLVGVYLVEYGRGVLARTATFMVDILTGVPSIVAALFIYALVITTFHGQTGGWLVSLALVILMIPVVVRTTEEMLRLVPNELREASYALGVPKWKTVVKVVIPTAASGLLTGIVLGVARVAGETAPLLILTGYATNKNWNPFSSSFQASLPSFINQQFIDYRSSSGGVSYHLDANGNKVAGASANFAGDRLWAAALTLVILVMALNLIARLISRRSKIST